MSVNNNIGYISPICAQVSMNGSARNSAHWWGRQGQGTSILWGRKSYFPLTKPVTVTADATAQKVTKLTKL